jgi:hypothetical protein
VAHAALRLENLLAGGGTGGEGGPGGSGEQQAGNYGARQILWLPSTTTSMILWAFSIVITTVELLIEGGQTAFGNRPCGSSTNLAAMPWSNWA